MIANCLDFCRGVGLEFVIRERATKKFQGTGSEMAIARWTKKDPEAQVSGSGEWCAYDNNYC